MPAKIFNLNNKRSLSLLTLWMYTVPFPLEDMDLEGMHASLLINGQGLEKWHSGGRSIQIKVIHIQNALNMRWHCRVYISNAPTEYLHFNVSKFCFFIFIVCFHLSYLLSPNSESEAFYNTVYIWCIYNTDEFPIKLLSFTYICFFCFFCQKLGLKISPLRLQVNTLKAFPDCRSALIKSWFYNHSLIWQNPH